MNYNNEYGPNDYQRDFRDTSKLMREVDDLIAGLGRGDARAKTGNATLDDIAARYVKYSRREARRAWVVGVSKLVGVAVLGLAVGALLIILAIWLGHAPVGW